MMTSVDTIDSAFPATVHALSHVIYVLRQNLHGFTIKINRVTCQNIV